MLALKHHLVVPQNNASIIYKSLLTVLVWISSCWALHSLVHQRHVHTKPPERDGAAECYVVDLGRLRVASRRGHDFIAGVSAHFLIVQPQLDRVEGRGGEGQGEDDVL